MAFTRPRNSSSHNTTPHLFVANCGPAVGLSSSTIHQAFSRFGPVLGVRLADDTGSRVIVSFSDPSHAHVAREAWNGVPCTSLHNRLMHIQFSVPQVAPQVEDPFPISRTASELKISGLYLYKDFISEAEEQGLLAAVDESPWQSLSKRRVQHYGYEFNYKTRNVDTGQKVGELPHFVQPLLEKILNLEELKKGDLFSPFDQLTVNEYPSGVGLSPHVDTHSAFDGAIISVSLAGSCVMEFRKYNSGAETPVDDGFQEDEEWAVCEKKLKENGSNKLCVDDKQENLMGHDNKRWSFERRAIFLPRRSLLLLLKDARYGWHHYIPHRKVDFVNGERIERSSRRVSFTFRKVRLDSCNCAFQHCCDSQASTNISLPLHLKGVENLNGEGMDIETTDVGVDVEYPLEFPCAAGLSRHKAVEVSMNRVMFVQKRWEENFSNLEYSNFSLAATCGGSSFADILAQESCQGKVANGLSESKSVSRTPEIEKKYVHGVYDAIAPHFSSTRFAKWPKVAGFLDSLAPGSIVVDSGCGNGNYLGLNPNCIFVGCDISPSLVSICAQRGHEVLVADALSLPYRTEFSDAAISIAVLHHLSTEGRRQKAIIELLRVVCRGGKILITVWAVEQEDMSLVTKWTPLTSKYMEEWVDDISPKVSRGLSLVPLESIKEKDYVSERREIMNGKGFIKEEKAIDRSEVLSRLCSLEQKAEKNDRVDAACKIEKNQEEQQEYFVPWHLPYHQAEVSAASAAAVATGLARKDDSKGAMVYNRYYHVFVEGELERLVSSVNGVRIVDHFYDKSNWCVIIEKL